MQRVIDLVQILIEKIQEVPNDAFVKLDKVFFRYAENLNILNIEFVNDIDMIFDISFSYDNIVLTYLACLGDVDAVFCI